LGGLLNPVVINFNCITVHFYSSTIDHQKMHLGIIKRFNIFLGTLLHVSAGSSKFLAKITHNYSTKMWRVKVN
jgi:hypothetical protein